MFWAILSPIFLSFSTIFLKKSLLSQVRLSSSCFSLLGFTGYLIFLAYFFFFWKLDFSTVNWWIIFLVIWVSGLWAIIGTIAQYVYTNEKISVITPYENLNKVISMVLSYFIFHDVTFISFLLGIFIVLIIIVGSLDFKKIQFPRFFWIFFLHQVLTAVATVAIGYALTKVGSVEYFILENVFMIGMYIIVIFMRRETQEFKKGNKKFYTNRSLASFMDACGYFISLVVIASLGISTSIIISFVYLAAILILSYAFFKEIPEKRSVFFSFIVLGLVTLAMYFNS